MKRHVLNSAADVFVLQSSANKQVALPQKSIDIEMAKVYYNNFYNTRLANGIQNQTKATWFELDGLKNYFSNVIELCANRDIEITRFAFLLGATKKGNRTVLIAPVTYDEKLDLQRAFSLDNDNITYLYRFPGEDHSDVQNFKGLHSTSQSLVLSSSGMVSSAKAIELYNNYHDTILAPNSDKLASDSRFVYYEKGEFENYISFLCEQAQENNIGISGINAIFGAKNDYESEGMFANLVTLFFAPTVEGSKTAVITSFDAPKENVLDLRNDRWDSTKEKALITTMFNRGSGAPPPYHWD